MSNMLTLAMTMILNPRGQRLNIWDTDLTTSWSGSEMLHQRWLIALNTLTVITTDIQQPRQRNDQENRYLIQPSKKKKIINEASLAGD